MRDIIVQLQNGWPGILPFIWSGLLTVASFSLFWLIRGSLDNKVSGGTDLFALLAVADLSVLVGTIDISKSQLHNCSTALD